LGGLGKIWGACAPWPQPKTATGLLFTGIAFLFRVHVTVSVAGPTICNNLPEYLQAPELSIDNFRRQLKTFLFAQ